MKRAQFLLILPLALAITGCTGYSPDSPGSSFQEEPDTSEWDAMQDEAAAEAYVEDQMAEQYASTGWVCSYEPTMNDDWHDDAVCRNGVEVIRPYLREWDDFVTEAELMESAREFAAELNAG